MNVPNPFFFFSCCRRGPHAVVCPRCRHRLSFREVHDARLSRQVDASLLCPSCLLVFRCPRLPRTVPDPPAGSKGRTKRPTTDPMDPNRNPDGNSNLDPDGNSNGNRNPDGNSNGSRNPPSDGRPHSDGHPGGHPTGHRKDASDAAAAPSSSSSSSSSSRPAARGVPRQPLQLSLAETRQVQRDLDLCKDELAYLRNLLQADREFREKTVAEMEDLKRRLSELEKVDPAESEGRKDRPKVAFHHGTVSELNVY